MNLSFYTLKRNIGTVLALFTLIMLISCSKSSDPVAPSKSSEFTGTLSGSENFQINAYLTSWAENTKEMIIWFGKSDQTLTYMLTIDYIVQITSGNTYTFQSGSQSRHFDVELAETSGSGIIYYTKGSGEIKITQNDATAISGTLAFTLLTSDSNKSLTFSNCSFYVKKTK